ncbi:histidinol-phosphate transaminase [Cellulomonas bogoriensis]|uniref:Aromatic amino acid aminotransferase n=1 Tax=Cellulomonas bogoriensis 69B4 = DSM 16987 TaxID=1386082 RepID=A0A0A0BTB7_9CELL|nr:histidinol-phosphate transaminase [Cellulomonas bogoriensis]KGM11658.1 aminotransferase [Cellulomonas bogoriensis 69B4 = DSM 16987]
MSVPLRPAVERIPAYVPGARAATGQRVHKLSSNENPYGPLPTVQEAVAQAAGTLNRYPDMFASELTEAVAARHGVTPEHVVAGCGSVAVLGHVLQAFCDPGDEVVHAWRSFEAYPIVIRLQGATPVPVPVDADGRHDLPAMLAAVTDRTRAVLLCSPNNPTGPALRHTQVAHTLAALPDDVLVVLDEAYVEFVRDEDPVDSRALLAAHPNLVVLRTFSKAYGLAGLRVGYAVARPDVARGIRTASTPFGVNHLAQVAAVASLQPDAQAELDRRVDAVVAERHRVLTGLRAQGWTVPDSQGNLVWLPTGPATADLAADAAAHGVLVRPFAGEGIRVSIGEPDSNDRVLELAGRWREHHQAG